MVHELEDISYSRQETIQAFTDFYEFLRKLYIRDCDVIYPPAGGWPSIVNASPDLRQAFGKSDEVIALLAHLPYIRSRQQEVDMDPEVFPGQHMIDWQGAFAAAESIPQHAKNFIQGLLRESEGVLYPLRLPGVVPLATASFAPTPVITLDTGLGIICWDGSTCPQNVQVGYSEHCIAYDDDPGSDIEEGSPGEEYIEFRQSSGAWSIPGFFEVLKDQFKRFYWVPSSHFCLLVQGKEIEGEEGSTDMVQGIFREHGWPDSLDRYDRDICLVAVMEALGNYFPDKIDYREKWASKTNLLEFNARQKS